MSKISFLGGTGTVTGSRFLLQTDGCNLLVDCGLFQGPKALRLKNRDSFPVPPSTIDKVLLTHAHIDHTGYIPKLCKDGFKGQIHSTHATAELCDILLRDSAYLQKEDADWANKKKFSRHKPAQPLYSAKDAIKALERFEPLHFGQNYFFNDNLRIKFKDSGHLLGSAFVEIKTTRDSRPRKILFTGDMGRASRPILNDPVQVYNVDYLVLESTYGNRLHETGNPLEQLTQVILESRERGGVLVIPAFSVGRTQTLLYVIRELEEQGKIPVMNVYVDSPMAVNATEVFERRIPDLDLDSRLAAIQGKKVFRPKRVAFCKERKQSKVINDVKSNAIIISASGMATGGRILHHLTRCLPDKKNTLLLIGYQAYGTRGRSILEGKLSVKIHGREVPINCTVANIDSFSGHADYEEILAWLMGFNRPPEKTFIVHGEASASASMAEKIRSQYGWDVVVPEEGASFDLDL
ncbi:MAG: MBL fold metallo-hydrolase [FCB group bacterium]|nr:MBL fold metallo-hydrolase [FCB group bacterium]